ncbi:hypothetical protein, partial [Parabacteroides merdae]|uniref:hypothetical protein n=1 Tax=Parabacteroides merdae TaxID=46503 RepID=UPI0034A38A08
RQYDCHGYLAVRQDIRECWIGHPSVRVASYVGSLNQIEGKIPHPAVLIEVSFFYLLGFGCEVLSLN